MPITGVYTLLYERSFGPGNSPDLNPIEHLWPILQDSVFKVPKPRTREELIARVVDSWRSMSPELLRSLVFSFPRRIEECLEKNGSHTRY